MGREAAEALESTVTGGGLESSAIEAGELGPAEPALDVVSATIEPGETGDGGKSLGGLAEPGELGPAGLEHSLEPGGGMWAGDSAGRGPADAVPGPAEAVSDGLAADAAEEPGEAGPADSLDGGIGRGFQEAGETAEKGIETAEKDAESVGLGLGQDTAQAISAIEAAGYALAPKGAEASHHAAQAGLGHAVSGREASTGGSAIEHGVRPGLDRGTGQGTSGRGGQMEQGPGGGGDRQEQSGTRERTER
jgi:hypothetical protein